MEPRSSGSDLDPGPARLEGVLITEQLDQREARAPDHVAENLVLAELAGRLANQPETALDHAVAAALTLCSAATAAGVYVIGQRDDESTFYPAATAGVFADQLNDEVPRHLSPCDIVLSQDSPQLFRRPGRHYPGCRALEPAVVETLLAPLHVGGRAAGALWIATEQPDGHFEAEDGRLLGNLAPMAAAAYAARISTVAEAGGGEHLERRVAERTAEMREQAQCQAEHLRELSVQLAEAEQRERQRLAKVLHDHLQQLLVAARMRAEALGPKPESHEEDLETLVELLRAAIDASRTLAMELDPPILHELGLMPAVRWQARRMRQLHGLETSVEPDREKVRLPTPFATFLFHATREMLFNVVKHARAKRAWVRFEHEGRWVRLTVEDDGIGCELGQQFPEDGGFGLATIQQRVAFWQGRLRQGRGEHGGCRIDLTLPLDLAAED